MIEEEVVAIGPQARMTAEKRPDLIERVSKGLRHPAPRHPGTHRSNKLRESLGGLDFVLHESTPFRRTRVSSRISKCDGGPLSSSSARKLSSLARAPQACCGVGKQGVAGFAAGDNPNIFVEFGVSPVVARPFCPNNEKLTPL